MAKDVHAEVTARIVAQLETGAGSAPWVRPWSGCGSVGCPRNAESRRGYNGINRLLLWLEQQAKGYARADWLTYQQAKKLGGQVRKGETGTLVVLVKPIQVSKRGSDGAVVVGESGEAERKNINLLRGFYVFNVAQIDKLPARFYAEQRADKPLDDPAFEAWIAATGATIQHGFDSAFYRPSADIIGMPKPGAFKNKALYKGVLLHELTHWTGAKKRLDRNLSCRFGDEAYAAEELVAELGAAFLCADMGIDGNLRHADYIASWVKLTFAVVRASCAASCIASTRGWAS